MPRKAITKPARETHIIPGDMALGYARALRELLEGVAAGLSQDELAGACMQVDELATLLGSRRRPRASA